MPHVDDRPGRPSGRMLPPSALAGLREAFAGEVSARLPRLQALVEREGDRIADHEQAVRDAHCLGSSAVVVGEAEASRAARALETELVALGPGAAVPPSAAAHVRTLAILLSPWLAA